LKLKSVTIEKYQGFVFKFDTIRDYSDSTAHVQGPKWMFTPLWLFFFLLWAI